ncbi:hypothetical protein BDW68DRAFT_139245 [Aspergillus falconensis]
MVSVFGIFVNEECMYTPGCIRPGVRFRFERCFKNTLREGTSCSPFPTENTSAMLVVPLLGTRSPLFLRLLYRLGATPVLLVYVCFCPLSIFPALNRRNHSPSPEVQVAVEVVTSGIVCFHVPLTLSEHLQLGCSEFNLLSRFLCRFSSHSLKSNHSLLRTHILPTKHPWIRKILPQFNHW